MRHPALLSLLVMTTFATPALARPVAAAQEVNRERHAEPRIYDRDHKDYHVWNDAEDRAYRSWLETKRFSYRQYSRLKGPEQREYWSWRHDHRD